jgi:type II secretory pathway pseudopilin PulG
MIELLVAMTLLSLIVLVLMAVFNSTQQAFRASVTQTDVLEGSRATMELITADLQGMVPSYGVSNYVGYNGSLNTGPYYYGGVNFAVTTNSYWNGLLQQLPAANGARRTNVLEYFFILGKVNTKWTGTGYYVNATNMNPIYPLYRYYAETNIDANPVGLYWNFLNTIYYAQWTNMSHVMDGVAHLVVRGYDNQGYWLTNGYPRWLGYALAQSNRVANVDNVWFSAPTLGEVGGVYYSNAVPASVELQLGVLEDRTRKRTETFPTLLGESNFLSGQAGHVQMFRQRVTIPSVDVTAYH